MFAEHVQVIDRNNELNGILGQKMDWNITKMVVVLYNILLVLYYYLRKAKHS